ncbi:MAG: histidine phosphatase family protein [Bacteroidales bacterium]
MKTLYIVRHAKSSWAFPGLPDIDRPIVDKGINNTKKIVIEMNNRKVQVDLLISSHAKRAYETAKIIATGINYAVEKIEVSEGIYRVNRDDIFNILFALNDTIDSVMIVGHNPTLTQFANLFLDKKIDILPTSGVISISFKINNWIGVIKAKPKTNFTLFPKLLN